MRRSQRSCRPSTKCVADTTNSLAVLTIMIWNSICFIGYKSRIHSALRLLQGPLQPATPGAVLACRLAADKNVASHVCTWIIRLIQDPGLVRRRIQPLHT